MDFILLGLSMSLSFIITVYGYNKSRVNLLSNPLYLSNIFFLLLYFIPLWYFFDEYGTLSTVISLGVLSINLGLLISNYNFSVKNLSLCCLNNNCSENAFNRIPTWFVIVVYMVAILSYASLYVQRGIPLFSGNIDIARAHFIEGSGHISRTSTALMVISVLLLITRKKLLVGFSLLVVALLLLMLSGWRGYVVAFIFPLIVVLSILSLVRVKHLALAFVGLVLVVMVGLYRASISGAGIYGVDILQNNFRSIPEGVMTYLIYRMAEHLAGLKSVLSYSEYEYLYGKGLLMDMSALTPGGSYKLSELMRDIYGGWDGGGGMTLTLFGTFYADFGIAGVVIFSFIAGLLYSFLFWFFLRNVKYSQIGIILGSVTSYAWVFSLMGSFVAQFIANVLMYSIMTAVMVFSYLFIKSAFRRSLSPYFCQNNSPPARIPLRQDSSPP